jgi:NodT family efflux transporter outer membrane factor (OMF) lipoprotein
LNHASLARFALTLSALLAGGCTVGPDFVRPAPPAVSAYTPVPMQRTADTPNVVEGGAQDLAAGQDIPQRWWELFDSSALNTLVERSLQNNHDLKAAEAALLSAHENVLAQRAAYYPAITATASATRSKSSTDLSPTPSSGALLYSLFTPALSVAYVPDVFGANRRQVELVSAQEQATGYQRQAVYTTFVSNIVVAVIQEAALRAQLSTTESLIDLNEHSLTVLRAQKLHGYATQLDVAAQESAVAQARATLPPLQKQLEIQRNLLATLSGNYAGNGLPERFGLDQLHLPSTLPLSIPSQLIEHRPDVRQAEENVHAASAAVGVAVAARLPNITLTADAGKSAVTLGALSSAGTNFWDLGAALAQPVFDGGALLHKERAARAALQQAREQYRSTALTAFQNVADALVAIQRDSEALQAAAASASASKVTLDTVRVQRGAGYANYLQELAAEQSYQSALLQQIQAQAGRLADSVALLQALGGGWWNRAAG